MLTKSLNRFILPDGDALIILKLTSTSSLVLIYFVATNCPFFIFIVKRYVTAILFFKDNSLNLLSSLSGTSYAAANYIID